MFIAKFKSVTLLLCGIAVLGLATGGLLRQTRARAAEQDARAESQLETLEQARKEAAMQRDRAEAERIRAEAALIELKKQLVKAQDAEKLARQRAEKALYAENIRQAQKELSQKPEGLSQLSAAEARVREQFEMQRQSLKEQLKKLEVEEQVTLRKLAAERGLLSKQQSGDKSSAAGDKLDRILERLERMERRLERLERGGSSSGSSRQ